MNSARREGREREGKGENGSLKSRSANTKRGRKGPTQQMNEWRKGPLVEKGAMPVLGRFRARQKCDSRFFLHPTSKEAPSLLVNSDNQDLFHLSGEVDARRVVLNFSSEA